MRTYLPTTLRGSLLSNFFDDENFLNSRWLRGREMPAVNIKESEKNVEIEVAAPGYEKKDFHIDVEDGILTISAEYKKTTDANGEDDYRRKEFECGSFSRSFTLPQNVKDEDINAKYENGILKLNIARREEPKSNPKKTIEIR